jgi:hypothetical protein
VPPVAVAVNVTEVPTVPVAGPAIVTARARGETVTVAVAVAVAAGVALSVATTMIEADPFALKVVVKLAPVPLDGVPPLAVHAKVTDAVPPDDVAVQLTAVPTVPVVGQLIVTVRLLTTGLMTMVADAVAVNALESVTVTLTV